MNHSKLNILKRKAILVMATAIAMLFATSAYAEEKPAPNEGFCAYTPSSFITGAITGIAAITSATGIGLKSAGFYTLNHSVTGTTMLGSTAAGSSAAGTVGIIPSSGGFIGTTTAFLMSPMVIKGAIVVAVVGTVGVITYEGYCYFTEDSDEETPE